MALYSVVSYRRYADDIVVHRYRVVVGDPVQDSIVHRLWCRTRVIADDLGMTNRRPTMQRDQQGVLRLRLALQAYATARFGRRYVRGELLVMRVRPVGRSTVARANYEP